MPINFAVIGAAGYIAPRHLKAIRDVGGRVAAAVDPSDSVGILDSYGYDVRYFREIERFDRHLDKARRGLAEGRVDWVTVCSPNYLHDAHIRIALRNGANALCEKPIVINPWNLDGLEELEKETDRRVFTILQLRTHPQLIALRDRLRSAPSGRRHQVNLTYITSRGPWYHVSWKGVEEKSGGIATNIGIHLFDLLLWLFGAVKKSRVIMKGPSRMAGEMELADADVRWLLSVNNEDLPGDARERKRTTFRSITIDGEEVEFSEGFTELHTAVYRRTLDGQGFGISDARPSVELAHSLRSARLDSN
ncbi:MAG TPA: Gfo/Idh/MocA family oxidoreductase [Thermoanaerobaculia bacterium]|nr:Gfo/Idh/MocA family oxidoreductase [Thermoanaerobaculia bacterium]